MKFTFKNKLIKEFNRGGIKFLPIDGIFDTEVYQDTRVDIGDRGDGKISPRVDMRYSSPISKEQLALAKAEVEEVITNMAKDGNAEIIGEKKAKEAEAK